MWGGGGFKVIIWVARHKEGDQFLWGELTPVDTMEKP